jgi:serine protease Do
VVIDARGYVLTAEAVVAGASTIGVAVPGGKTVAASVVGSDPQDALTLLKVDSPGLHPLSTSGASQLANGAGVVVLAAPPYSQVAIGAVASVHASVAIADPSNPLRRRPLNDLLALDVAPRDGQLGAPVLDGAGRFAGMVVAAGTQAFAVDMTQAQPLVQQLVDGGRVTYPTLGFEYQQLSVSEASDHGVAGGVLVSSVEQPTADAGLAVGDVVVSANGTTLDPAHPLARLLRGLSVRQAVQLLVSSRGGQPHQLTLFVQLVSP